jgi:N4 gp69-like protein|nr:MAG TPA: hypothetical protein [Caudoviricetes sp.]
MNQEVIVKEDLVDLEVLKKVTPKKLRYLVNEKLVEQINSLLYEPEYRDAYRENLLGYVNVLNDPNTKMTNYLQAVKYCTFKLAGSSNMDAYIKTFPDRYKRMLADGKDSQAISSYVAAWNRSRIVTSIMEQAAVPVWLVNADLFQEAINVQAHIMRTARSEKVRSDAANSLINHLKQPEVTKHQLDIGIKPGKELLELREAIEEHSKLQQLAIASGNVTAKAIAEMGLSYGQEDN